MATYTPDEFADILTGVPVEVAKAAHGVVDDAAGKVRTSARRNARAANPKHARKVPPLINADVDRLTADIGYDDIGQGRLGIILEYGDGQARNAPQRNLGRALDEHEAGFVQRLADVAYEKLAE